jgi:hypothetical protein
MLSLAVSSRMSALLLMAFIAFRSFTRETHTLRGTCQVRWNVEIEGSVFASSENVPTATARNVRLATVNSNLVDWPCGA